MVDANWAYDVAEAGYISRQLANLDVHLFEEPVQPQNIHNYTRLTQKLDVPLAGGESWAYIEEFQDIRDCNAVGYLQPDITSVGGTAPMRRIVSAADAVGVQVYPHVFGTAVAVAASLQILSTVPSEPLLEFDRTANPIRDELPVNLFTNDGPLVHTPDQPGLGVTSSSP